MWTCGIDWAEKHLDLCLQNPSGDVTSRQRVDNNEEGFHAIMALFADKNIDEVGVAIESPHEPVVDFLLSRGISVYPVNPNAIDQYRKSLKVSGSKSDAADAQLIASYLRQHHQTLRGWQVSEPALRQLQLLVVDREKLVKEKVRLQNQLRSTLRGYLPQAIDAFSDLTTPTALAFLTQFPTPGEVQEKNETDWVQFLDTHRVFHRTARSRFLSALSQPSIQADEAIVAAKSLLTETLVTQLQSLMAAISIYEERIEALLDQFPDGKRFKSLPGVSIILGAKLLVALGTDRTRFVSANELQSFFGTAPYTKSSGKHRSVHFRTACHKSMRTALQQMAFSSLRSSTWAKQYFHRKRKEGKRKHYALRCLANLWLKVIFAIWKKKQSYDENKHLASITRHTLSQPV